MKKLIITSLLFLLSCSKQIAVEAEPISTSHICYYYKQDRVLCTPMLIGTVWVTNCSPVYSHSYELKQGFNNECTSTPNQVKYITIFKYLDNRFINYETDATETSSFVNKKKVILLLDEDFSTVKKVM